MHHQEPWWCTTRNPGGATPRILVVQQHGTWRCSTRNPGGAQPVLQEPWWCATRNPGGEPQEKKPDTSTEKLQSKTDSNEGLLGGGGMPDPTPA